jgi:serine/threonine protein kinase
MPKNFRQYSLTIELARKHSHTTYLASAANEPHRQLVLTVFASWLSHFTHESENVLQKAQCIQELEHPHLVPILDMGIEDEQPFVVREYLPHGSLRSRMKQIAPDRLELADALTILLQVGQALAYAHERDIVHSNIKPENILFDANGQAILADFYLVSRKDALMRDQTSEEYAFCYLAPEQFVGISDAKSDQYALGCLAYELITGRVPFTAQTLASIMGHQSNTLPNPLSESVADLPPSLEAAVLKTLAKDPAERFYDFSLFLEAIESTLSPPPDFSLLHPTYSRKKRTPAHPVPKEEVADASVAVASVSGHEQSESRITKTSSSLLRSADVHRASTGQILRGRRRLFGLVLFLSAILAVVTFALCPSRLFIPDASSHISNSTIHNLRAKSITNPGFILVPIQRGTPTAIATPSPTAIPRPSPMAIPTPNLTATAIAANANPYSPHSGTLALSDPLKDNSRGYQWQETPPTSSNGGWSCQFTGGAYYAQAQNNIYASCGPAVRPGNFTFEAQMQIINGNCGGFTLRDGGNGNAYSFQVCQDGSYQFNRFASSIQTLTSGSSVAIATGSNRSNLIALVANGSHFDLYANHQKLGSANDSSYSSGGFGLTANAAYTNARMWTW